MSGSRHVLPNSAAPGSGTPTLLAVSEPGTRWFVTDTPFDGTFLAQLDVGDRFTYPAGHGQERETYRWDGDSWEFESTLDAVPAAASQVVYAHPHGHSGSDISSGTVGIARLPTGTSGTTVALGNHTHAGADIASGTVDVARLPTGTSGSTVALGNHTHAGAWSDATLGTNVSANTAVNPGTRLEGDRVFMRGQLAWSSATLNAGHVLMTVALAHRPASAKRFSARTSPTSNVSSVLNLATNGQLTNVSGFGSSTSGDCPVDGLSYDLS